jgi:hypothetical protein
MNMYEKTNKYAALLESTAQELDIPESKYLEAKKRYESVGEWLSKIDSPLAIYNPEIYPQGSFSLGTVIKPISNKDEYDIDLVCFLTDLKMQDTSQQDLKRIVGNRLKQNGIYNRLIDEEGRRCWTLNYADEFHMDILPAIPDEECQINEDYQINRELYDDSILITDKKKIDRGDLDWPKSNPKGYIKWFLSRQETVYKSIKEQMAESLKMSIDDVPDYKIKTPLQRTVQILKRHRDIYFSKKQNDYSPISIIITTLAADIYNGQDNIYNAIYDILQNIDEEMLKRNERWEIQNPANPGENFADKWNENPLLPKAFFDWLENAKATFCNDIIIKEVDTDIKTLLNECLGVNIKTDTGIGKTAIIAPAVHIKVNDSNEQRPWGYV